MSKFTVTLLILVLTAGVAAVSAQPLSRPRLNEIKQRPEIREQMDKMILSMFDMDIMTHKVKELDYEILQEDAERILAAIREIRAKDKAGVLYRHLRKLEDPTRALLKTAMQKDPKAAKYPEQIFNACFQCHSVYRDNPLY